MMIFNNGRQAQGEALPAAVRRGTIQPAGGLDTHQQGWRTRHPIATTYKGQSAPNPPFLATCRGSIRIWGHGSGAKENAPTAPLSFVALSCGYPIRLGLSKPRIHTVTFTFLIAPSACRLADLRRIRTITAVADTEAQARIALAGLPLVFLSRTPSGRAAA